MRRVAPRAVRATTGGHAAPGDSMIARATSWLGLTERGATTVKAKATDGAVATPAPAAPAAGATPNPTSVAERTATRTSTPGRRTRSGRRRDIRHLRSAGPPGRAPGRRGSRYPVGRPVWRATGPTGPCRRVRWPCLPRRPREHPRVVGVSRAPSIVAPGTGEGVDRSRPGPAVGRSIPRRDGPAKVTGAARYTDDLRVPDAWHGVTVRSTEPHARLLGIERDPAFDWSRVVVLTAADIPGENVVALLADDQPVLVADEIRHVARAGRPRRGTGPRHGAGRARRDHPADGAAAARPRPARVRARVRRASRSPGATSRRRSPRRTSSSRAPTGSATRSSCTSSRRR